MLGDGKNLKSNSEFSWAGVGFWLYYCNRKAEKKSSEITG